MNIYPVGILPFKAGSKVLNVSQKVKPAVLHNTDTNSKMLDTVSFLGIYYATTDSHSRLPMAASTLSEIERRANSRENINEPVFLLDCGDFAGDSYSHKSIADMYIGFQKRNPDITCVFNLGNYDLNPLVCSMVGGFGGENAEIIRRMADSGINIVSASYCEAVEKLKKEGVEIDELEFIKPYIILDDIADGKNKKYLYPV